MVSLADLRKMGLAPQTEKEAKEMSAKTGAFFVTGSEETDPSIEELGLPTIRIPDVSSFNVNMLKNMTPEARGALLGGTSFSVGPDGSLKFCRLQDILDARVREAYSRLFSRDLSLEECSQTNLWFTKHFPDCIEFSATRLFDTQSILQKCANLGNERISTNDLPLYYSHVLCNYSPQIRFVANGLFEIALNPKGPHLSAGSPFDKYESGRALPTIRAMVLVDDYKGSWIVADLLPGDDGHTLITNEQFALADLKEHPTNFVMKLRLYIPRAHFDLASIIDLDAPMPSVSDKTARTVETILRGEKPPGADWEITVAEAREGGDVPQRMFHVHKAAFSSISNRLETVFREGFSVAHDSIGVVAGKQRCSFPRLSVKDMQVVIPLAYGLVVPLPTSGVPFLVESIRRIFNADHLKDTLAPQWERLICREALTLDTKQVSSFAPVFRLLSIIWSFPRGWMPVAKRVAIGVLADIVHRNAGDEVDKFIENQYPEIYATATHSDDTEKWNEMMQSMNKHLYMVSSVLKSCPKQEKEVLNDEEVKTMNSAVVSVDQENSADVSGDQEWHDDEVHGGFNPADMKCQCVIT